MIEILKEAFTSPAGSVAQVAFIFLGIVFLVWKVSHFNTKFNDLDKIGDKFNLLEDKFEKKFDRTDSKIDEIKQSVMVVKSFIDTFQSSNNPLAQSHSPVSLTETGKKVAEEIQLKQLVTNHWSFIKEKFDEFLAENSNPYDIQVASFKVGDLFQTYLTNEELNVIKLNAFERGYDISLYEIVFGIEIRDRILEERGITPKEVDDYSPIEE